MPPADVPELTPLGLIPFGLLPAGAACAASPIRAAADRTVGALPLPGALTQSVARRQREFRAGRVCAAQALSALLGPPTGAGWVVPSGADGAPIWPEGIVGSITHTRALAAAVVLPATAGAGIGLDAEPFMAAARATTVAATIAESAELAGLAAVPLAPHELLTVVFSVKEALFKALYPHVRQTFDYAAAAVDRLDLEGGTFAVHLRTTLTPDLPAGLRIDGRVAVAGRTVFACVHLPPPR